MRQGRRSIREYQVDFEEQYLLAGDTLPEPMKMTLFRKGLDLELQKLLAGFSANTYQMLVERAIMISDDLYRVSIHSRTIDVKNTYAKSGSSRAKERYFSKSYLRSPSPEPMEGVEFTGKFGKKRLSDKEYSWRIKEGCCYNCGRKGHRA